MRLTRPFPQVVLVLAIAGLLVLGGCSNLGSRMTGWAARGNQHESVASNIGKIKSDELGRPRPGSVTPATRTTEESSRPLTDETRGRVALAMGQMLEEALNLEAAQAHYEQAVKLDPKSLKASLALARVYARLGRPDAALRVYQAAEQHHRKSAALFNDKGLLLAEQKDWPGATAALRTAVKLDPSESKYHNNLGMVLASSEAYEDAWKEFREAIGPGPAHYNLAVMLLQAGRTTEARNHLERALAAMPNLEQARTLLAQLNGTTSADGPATRNPKMPVDRPKIDEQKTALGPPSFDEPDSAADTDISPMVASEPPTSPEPNSPPDAPSSDPGPPAETSPPSKRWVPPKWLR